MFGEDIAIDPGIHAKRQYTLSQQRNLYLLMAMTLGLALLAATLAFIFPKVGEFIERFWAIALVAGVLAFLLIALCYFLGAFQKQPISLAIYALFTFLFVYVITYLVLKDKSMLFYFALWIVFLIILGYLIYSHATNTYMSTLVAIMIVVAAALVVFLVFLIFTHASFLGLLFAMLAAMLFGYYLSYDVRKNTRGTLFDPTVEEPFSGAVRAWIEPGLVFMRFLEMVGYGCCKHKTSV